MFQVVKERLVFCIISDGLKTRSCRAGNIQCLKKACAILAHNHQQQTKALSRIEQMGPNMKTSVVK